MMWEDEERAMKYLKTLAVAFSIAGLSLAQPIFAAPYGKPGCGITRSGTNPSPHYQCSHCDTDQDHRQCVSSKALSPYNKKPKPVQCVEMGNVVASGNSVCTPLNLCREYQRKYRGVSCSKSDCGSTFGRCPYTDPPSQ